MIEFVLTQPQSDQLALLKAFGAVSEETSVGPKAGGHRYCPGINGVMLSVALVPKGLVGAVKVPARYGEPKMTLYWITPLGLGEVEGARISTMSAEIRGLAATSVTINEFPYDPADDVAEQIP